MKREEEIQKIYHSKESYQAVKIPKELEQMVNRTIQQMENKEAVSMKKSSSKKYGRAAVAAAAAVVLCFTAGLNSNEAFAAQMSEIPVLGAVSKVLTFRQYEKEDADKKVSVKVPQIQVPEDETKTGTETGLPAEAEENKKTEEYVLDINAEIQKAVEEYERDAEIRIEEYKQAFLETGGTEEEFSEKEIAVDVDYRVTHESEDMLSLVLTANENWCSAYGVQYYYNLNLKEGKEIRLKDLLGEDYIAAANESIQKQIKERQEAGTAEYFDGSNGIEGFATIDEETDFYINEKGNPVVVFEKYEIAPGAYGAQEFEIVKQS